MMKDHKMRLVRAKHLIVKYDRWECLTDFKLSGNDDGAQKILLLMLVGRKNLISLLGRKKHKCIIDP